MSVDRVIRYAGLLGTGGAAALVWRSHAELIVAMTLALVVLPAVGDAVRMAWRGSSASVFRAPSRRPIRFPPWTPKARRRQARVSAYEPIEALYRKLSMAQASQYDAVVHLRPIVVRLLETHPECRAHAPVQRIVNLPNVRDADRRGGGISLSELSALASAFGSGSAENQ